MNNFSEIAEAGTNPLNAGKKWVLYFAAFIDSISVSIIMPFLPFMILKNGGSARTAGYVFATHAILAIVSGPVFGRISDRIGRRPTLVFAFLGMTCSYVVFGLSSSLSQIFVARAIAGTMSGGFGVIQATASDMCNPGERAKVIGYVVGASSCGYAVGPLIGLVAAAINQDSAVKVASLFGAALLLACGFMLWGTVPLRAHVHIKTTEASKKRSSVSGSVASLAIPLLLIMLAISLIQSGLVAVLGFWANSVVGWNERGVGWLFVLIFLVIGCNQLIVLPRVLDRFVVPHVLFGTLVGVTCGALTMSGIPHQLWVIVAAVAALFCGVSAGRTLVTSLITAMGSEAERGAALGNVSSAGYVGGALGPVFFGFLFVEAGPQGPFIAIALISTLCAIWLNRKIKKGWSIA